MKRGPEGPRSPQPQSSGESFDTYRTEALLDTLGGCELPTTPTTTPFVPEFNRAEIGMSLKPTIQPLERLRAHRVQTDPALPAVAIVAVIEDGSEVGIISVVIRAGENADEEESFSTTNVFRGDFVGKAVSGKGVDDREDRRAAKDEVEDCVD